MHPLGNSVIFPRVVPILNMLKNEVAEVESWFAGMESWMAGYRMRSDDCVGETNLGIYMEFR